jgi:nitrogen-specific signal transduction histidine kinase
MELTMLTALVLICSVAATPDIRDCTPGNATAVMRVPAAEFGNPATCFMHGQAYLAETSIGQELTDRDLVKVVCARTDRVDAAVRRLTAN